MAPIKQTHFCFDYAHLRFEGEIIIILLFFSDYSEIFLTASVRFSALEK